MCHLSMLAYMDYMCMHVHACAPSAGRFLHVDCVSTACACMLTVSRQPRLITMQSFTCKSATMTCRPQEVPESPGPEAASPTDWSEGPPASPRGIPRMNLHVGVLHYHPSCESFPLLADPVHYTPDTQDINKDREEMDYWLGVLHDQIPTVVAKAIASEHKTPGTE